MKHCMYMVEEWTFEHQTEYQMFNKLYFHAIINRDKHVDVKHVIDANANLVKWFTPFWDSPAVSEDAVAELFGGWLTSLFHCLLACSSGTLGSGTLNPGMCMFLEIWQLFEVLLYKEYF